MSTVPGQVFAALMAVAVTPAGNTSSRFALSVMGATLLLPKVMVTTLVPPALIVPGVKLFITVGALALTVKFAFAGLVLLPKLVVKVFAAMVLVTVPAVLEVTSTSIVQPPPGMMEPLVYVMVFAAATAVTVPGQLPPIFGVAATVTPAGNVSTKFAVKVASLVLIFPKVSVSVDVAPATIVLGLNALVAVGAAALTFKVALTGAAGLLP